MSNEIQFLQNGIFNVKIDYDENKYYILSNINFDRELNINFYDGDELIYQSTNHIKKGFEYWFSPSRKFVDVENLKVKILDDGKLIFKDGEFKRV